ncbi:MAG: hypothetical protein E6935_17450 [Clostridium butyricum]|uniref:hypothetical protein n=1 Tax=Clostridium TaxID=1485 RepID=UPI0018A8D14B|nr:MULTISPECIES: hypothetical protein [Clostridium]MDU1339984.1 hypothetical protein [Clostridium butyricum]MDU4589277.1 hypothetical protein [Clostridium sp.]
MSKLNILFILIIFSSITITACSKDEILDNYNNVIQSVGEYELTSDFKLKGNRTYGVDSYVGTYKADYENFSGVEYIFGGTSIKRSLGNTIEIKCNSNVKNGDAKLIIASNSDEEKVIYEFNESNQYSETIKLPSGRNYVGVECDGFSGNIDLVVK